MSTTRILIKQGDSIYRLLRFETSADGSLIALMDRDPKPERGGMTTNELGIFLPDEGLSGESVPSNRFSIHTTGEVHRYLGRKRKGTIHIEPLHALTEPHLVGNISIPRASRLDRFDPSRHRHDRVFTIEVSENTNERISFALVIGPKEKPIPGFAGFAISLNYEVYSAIVAVVPPHDVMLDPKVADHFIYSMRTEGRFEERQIDKASAELAFYRAAHPDVPPIFRNDDGAYVALAAVPMRIPPNLRIEFDRPDLRAEQAFDYRARPSHKVRFWIRDKGGRNRREDLRKHIMSLSLDADL
jgi:hypothetical protein